MKYIVYCTTNLKNSKIYIGVHKTTNPNKFDGYIGCGVVVPLKDKPFHINNPSTHLQKAINKYGYKNFYRTTLAEFDSIDEAYELESTLVTKEFIASKKSYNAVPGGKQPPYTTRQVVQYTRDGEFINLWDSIADATRCLGVKHPDVIRCCSEISRVTCSGFAWRYAGPNGEYDTTITVRKKPPRKKWMPNVVAVVQYSKTGYKMKTFSSVAEAGRQLNIQYQTISKCCNHTEHSHAGGYQWRFESDNVESLPPLVDQRKLKTVQQIKDSEVVNEFNSARDAAKSLGVETQYKTIKAACISGEPYKEYYWRFKVEDMI